VPCSICEDETVTSSHGVPGLVSPQLREAVLTEVREAASCASVDGECEKCTGHADAILAAVLATADGTAR
jgi:bacterioferritin-associated ferredoxin